MGEGIALPQAPSPYSDSQRAAHLSYAALNARANRLARHLRGLGVGPEDRVATRLARSPDLLIAWLGVLKAGGAVVPIDPDYPPERVRFVLEDSGATALVTKDEGRRTKDEARSFVFRLSSLVDLGAAWPAIAAERADNLGGATHPDRLACVIYTSGSTGSPKGVLGRHRGLCGRVAWGLAAAGLSAADRCLHVTSPGFDVAIVELFEPLAAGGQAVVAGPGGQRDSAYLARLIADQRVAVCNLTPAMLRLLLDEPQWARCRDLRHVFCGAEDLPADLARRFAARSRAALHNIYGPTEASVDAACWTCTSSASPTVPIGRPIAGAALYILGAQLQPVPIGVAGELHIAGPGLARGYLNRPDLTAERFVPNPFSKGSGARGQGSGRNPRDPDPRPLIPDPRLYKTGDLARWRSDGSIEFLGRSDRQIKLRGNRIELGEIESVLASCPGVRACAVVVREDPPGDRRLVAYLVTSDELPVTSNEQPAGSSDAALAAELRAFLAARLPAYMVPSAFVALEDLPRTPSGKIDRRALPAPGPAPRPSGVAPRSAVERDLARIWQDLLGLEQVGVDQNFFDLGGHSLLLVQLRDRLRADLGRDVPIVELFQHPTIARLAAHLSPAAPAAPDSPRPAAPAPPAASDIAIVGMAGRFPGSADVEQFWANLRDGVESIRFFSHDELAEAGVDQALLRQPNYVAAKGLLDDVDLFDAAFFGYTPREAELIDPQQRIFLECAHDALERAGHDPEREPGRIGVFAGSSLNSYWFNLYTNASLVESAGGFQTALGVDPDYLATRASYKLNLKGPSITVQSACSTSLVAVALACRSLRDGDCDLALAGGVSVTVPLRKGYLYQEGGIFSPDGHCRAFDADARGTVEGNGVGVVALRRLDDALADGDAIYAVIKGSAINNDGSDKIGYTAPSISGQAQVIAAAHAQAGVDPATIGYVEAHGTATPLGDPIELAALTQAFGGSGAAGSCALGAVKSNIGHLDAAAGVAGLIKAALALQHRQIPPSLHFERPNPQFDLAGGPFYVNADLAEWPAAGHPRRAGVSAFGIGGTNAHVVLEEPPAPAPADPAHPWQILTLSAKTSAALDAMTARLAAHLRAQPDLDLADVAYTLHIGRRQLAHRRALVCRDRADALAALESGDAARLRTVAPDRGARPVAFMFPGQGAQYVGMGGELYESEPVFRAEIDRCAEILRPILGLDLRDALYPADERRKTKDERPPNDDSAPSSFVLRPSSLAGADLDEIWLTLPALFAVDYALAQLWMSWGVQPDALIGYSMGEYVAATIAGVFSLDDALRLVAARGRLMHGTPAGAMLLVPLSEAEIRPQLAPPLDLALINGPALCVVAGPVAAIEDLHARLAARGLECRRLPVAHAYHSAMMAPIAEDLVAEVRAARLSPPRIPFVSNVTGDWITDAQATDPRYWGRHLCEPVRFADGLRALCADPGRLLLEVGPGRTLSALARLIDDQPDPPLAVASMRHPRADQPDRAALLTAAAELWLAGAPLRWPGLHAGERRRRVLLPTYPFERRRYWIEARAAQSRPSLPTTGKRSDVDDWFYLPAWRRSLAPRPFQPGDLAGRRARWLILADDIGLADRIAQRLAGADQDPAIVRAGAAFGRDGARDYAIDPRRAEDYDALLADLAARDAAPDVILHLWSLAPGRRRAGVSAPQRALDYGYYSLLFLAQALDRAGLAAPLRLEVVTSELHAIVPGEPAIPEQAALLGPCKVIPQEYPQIACRCIDVAAPRAAGRLAALADQLLAEFAAESPDALIVYRGPQRWVQTFEPIRLDRESSRRALPPGGSYLITGGMGAVGLLLAERLARGGARLALVGRTPLPPRERWDALIAARPDDHASRAIRRIRAIEALGSELLIVNADVADEAQMRAAVARVYARFGALDGVIHAAGATSGPSILRPLREIGPAESREQFRPKLDGARVLERALRGREFGFCMLFSSNAAVLGGLGFVAYAAANLCLDAFAERRSQQGDPRWISASWDGWLMAEEQIAPSAFHSSMDQYAMTRAEALAAFERVATRAAGQVVVSTGDLPARLAQWVARAPARELAEAHAEPARARHPRPSVQTAYAAPRGPVEEQLAAIWQDQLGIDRIGIDDNFFELGGHSLLAMRLMTEVQRQFGAAPGSGAPAIDLPLRALFEDPTVAGLAEQIERAQSRADRPPAILPAPRARRDGSDEAPLSFAQQRLWFLDRLQPNSAAYSIPAALRLNGRLDLAALLRSLAALVARHETLRTTFAEVDHQPVQRIATVSEGATRLPLLDLRGLPQAHAAGAARRLAHAEAQRPFDLARGPLIRAALLRLAADEHIALLTMHHIISDGWSIDLLTRELTARYAEFAGAATPAALPALPIQYADYAIWQRAWLAGERLQTQLDYWRNQLAGLDPLALPADRARTATPPPRGSRHALALPPAIGARLVALARQEESTLFMALLAAFQVLLARYSGQRDLAVGSPIAGRTRAETEGLIGFFVNTLVLRADLRGDPSFRALLARTRATCLEAYAHQDIPFDQIVEAVQPERELGRSPLFQVMLALQDAAGGARDLPGLRVEPLAVESVAVKFDIELGLVETSAGLAGNVIYNPDMFDATTIARLAASYRTLLESLVAAPDRPVMQAPLLGSAERQQILVEWNDTATEASSRQSAVGRRQAAGGRRQAAVSRRQAAGGSSADDFGCVHARFAAQAARTPDAVALAFDPDPAAAQATARGAGALVAQLSYAALDARANQLAHALIARGVGPEVRVGLLLDRSLELIIGVLGVLKAGGSYVPLDPAYPPERIAFMRDDSQVRVLVTKDEGRRTNAGGGSQASGGGSRELEAERAGGTDGGDEQRAAHDVRRGANDEGAASSRLTHHSSLLDLAAAWPALAQLPAACPAGAPDPANLAYVIYTSGSTGSPKGVMISQRALSNFSTSAAALFAVTPRDRMLQFASICFDVSVFEIFTALLSGATLCLTARDTLLAPPALTALLQRQRLTLMDMAPAVMALLPGAAFPDLRAAFVGGEAFSGELVKRWQRAGRQVINGYGPTEATVTMTRYLCAGAYDRPPPIGRPLPNHQMYLLDQRLEPVPLGATGELCIGGVGLARGYLGRPELTAAAFMPNPFAQGSGFRDQGSDPDPRTLNPDPRLYRTGDLARALPDGNIEFLGRRDQQIKIRGFRIELGEIAAALGQHPAVRECAVLAHVVAPGDARLAAYVVPNVEDSGLKIEASDAAPAAALSAVLQTLSAEFRAFLSERLPEHMIPSALVLLDALPLTQSGKLDRRALPAPDWSQRLAGQEYIAPRTPVEQQVAEAIGEMLHVDRVGLNDNFFALGGHSLLATRLTMRLGDLFDVKLPLRALFEAPTVADLAERVETLRWLAQGGRPPDEPLAEGHERGEI